MQKQVEQADCLVVGAGIAALTFALHWAETFPDSDIVMLNKGHWTSGNTWLAQGGIAAVSSTNDSFEKHLEDTLEAGQHLSDEEIAGRIIRMGPYAISKLERWGLVFDRDSDGKHHLGKEGGHSHQRIIHFQDSTGKAIIQQLKKRVEDLPNIRIFHHTQVLELITTHPGSQQNFASWLKNGDTVCQGAYAMELATGEIKAFQSPVTYLATGGSGQVFKDSTNSPEATGDGPALAIRAGLELQDMGFYQFHPTALYQPNAERKLLISEALRGAGAQILNQKGIPFLEKFDSRGALAPRDVVSHAIQKQLKKDGEPCVYLDASGIEKQTVASHFPQITRFCREAGYNFPDTPIPVIPVAHYQCGGIPVDQWGQTGLPGLYAGGECAYTGLHGANRLASNSLLEGLVMAGFSVEHCRRHFLDHHHAALPASPIPAPEFPNHEVSPDLIQHSKRALQSLMNDCAGLDTNPSKLEEGLVEVRQMRSIWKQKEAWGNGKWATLNNLLTTAEAILTDKLTKFKHEKFVKSKKGQKSAV